MLKSIIIVYDTAEINGGAANVAIRSAIALKKAGYDVHYFAAVGPINVEMINAGVRVECLFMNDINHGSRISAMINGVWNRKAKEEFRKYLSSFAVNETIVHFHGWSKALSSSVIKMAYEMGFRLFVTLHDYFTVCMNGGFYDFQRQELCRRKPMSYDCIKCNCDKRSYSQKCWRMIRQHVQDQNVRNNKEINYISISELNESLVKPLVKSKCFYRINNPVSLAEKKIEDCSKSNNFLCVGRVSEEKGVELFCKAISNIKKECDIDGIVVGDGPQLDYLRRNYPAIRFEGWKNTSEVKEYIQKARALVFPSRLFEGAPLTIVEAMSAGLPCIVSDCTSAIEIVKDGINGMVFKTNSADSLMKKIQEALDNDSILNLSVQIKKTFVRRDYTEKTHLLELLSVYEKALSG